MNTLYFSGLTDAPTGSLAFRLGGHNETDIIYVKSSVYQPEYQMKVIYSLIILICIPGIIGNGIVIRLLGSKIKRNSFTVYIVNLAMADSGTLLFLFLTAILYLAKRWFPLITTEGFICTYCTGQFLLTIISIDRCLALFFPIWYRCHQPPYLAPLLCVFSWLVSLLLCVNHYALRGAGLTKTFPSFYHILICTSICIPLMVVSSLALFVKGYLKSQMQKRGKLLKVTLLALFFFLAFSIPPTAIYLSETLFKQKYDNLITYGYLCACLNSSVNPLIYFLLGRKKEHHSTYNLDIILQTVFKEEEENGTQTEVQVDTQV
ncbi:proto-oncogene Mas-like [Thamnophis elegans]|uniref:proto-oncogene Mas-like n=1 Tax=Thamnophis elegans TaxID=35005 RepID=UPI001376AAC0|nr:proto-oncogene Mas-like [Thamnophis elegans]